MVNYDIMLVQFPRPLTLNYTNKAMQYYKDS